MRKPLICLCLDLGLNDLDLSAVLDAAMEATAAATGGLLAAADVRSFCIGKIDIILDHV